MPRQDSPNRVRFRSHPPTAAVTEEQLDQAIGEQAEREAEAQLDIVRALKLLNADSRRRVLEAVHHLIEADRLVPGILNAAAKGLKP